MGFISNPRVEVFCFGVITGLTLSHSGVLGYLSGVFSGMYLVKSGFYDTGHAYFYGNLFNSNVGEHTKIPNVADLRSSEREREYNPNSPTK